MEITPKLTEQTRRWLTRTIYEFYLNNPSGSGDEAYEQWHEDKAGKLLAFINMPESERIVATKELHVGSCNQTRINILKEV